MADMLSIGSAAANTFKTALNITSHNVANADTDGYSRQRAEISSSAPGIIGGGFLGGGSKVDMVHRIQADYIQTQLYSTNSGVERYSNQLQLAKQVEGLVAGNDEGIQQFLQRFYDSLQNVANEPTSLTSRQQVLDEAGNLESHINNLSSVLKDTQEQVNSQVKGLTTEVNQRLEIIQAINTQVSRALASNAQPPNDLLDQRDQAILELSSYVDIKTFPQADGQIDIHTANGRLPLLSDNTLTRLEAGRGEYLDENRTEVYISIGGQRENISSQIRGGALGGVLDFRTNMLDKTQNDLGVTLNALTASTNWQHFQGWDSDGNPGGTFFTPLEVKVTPSEKSVGDGSDITVRFNPSVIAPEPPYVTGGAPLSVVDRQAQLDDAFIGIGNLVSREYVIKSDNGTDFSIYDHKTGEKLLPATGSLSPGVYQLDGLEFDLSAVSATTGDKFLVQPHKDILEGFGKAIKGPDAIAARGQSPADPTGIPAPSGTGDNTNIANMASLFTKKLMFSNDAGKAAETIMGGYSTMASNVGMYTRGSDIQLTAQENVHKQMVMQRESLSGVSLDEEAANLLRFQQAYEAAAQIIATSQSIFQTLLGAVRGG